jgi:uncharacterized radical SAM superfamily Fe-S cluster-containing enzyme
VHRRPISFSQESTINIEEHIAQLVEEDNERRAKLAPSHAAIDNASFEVDDESDDEVLPIAARKGSAEILSVPKLNTCHRSLFKQTAVVPVKPSSV